MDEYILIDQISIFFRSLRKITEHNSVERTTRHTDRVPIVCPARANVALGSMKGDYFPVECTKGTGGYTGITLNAKYTASLRDPILIPLESVLRAGSNASSLLTVAASKSKSGLFPEIGYPII
jgi:hypothetical protein